MRPLSGAPAATSALIRETKTANPKAIVMMYSNAASALGDWRCNGLISSGLPVRDIWTCGSIKPGPGPGTKWASATTHSGITPPVGWTLPACLHAHACGHPRGHARQALSIGRNLRCLGVLGCVAPRSPSAFAGASGPYSHASVKTPKGIKVPDGSYISWANQGKRLLSSDDVAFLNTNISDAVIDAHKITQVYGPTLVYARSAAQWQAEHAHPDQDANEWLDEQVGVAHQVAGSCLLCYAN